MSLPGRLFELGLKEGGGGMKGGGRGPFEIKNQGGERSESFKVDEGSTSHARAEGTKKEQRTEPQ